MNASPPRAQVFAEDRVAAERRLAPAPRACAMRASNRSLILLASFLFLLPSAILAAGFQPAAALIVLIGCALSAALIWRTRASDDRALLAAEVDFRTLAGSAALALALCLLGGETHLFYANFDWFTRDAVLADLVRQGFPLFYRYEEQDYLLRAPLGMYMLPATVGHFLGLKAAHAALLAQNASALTLILYFLMQLSNAPKIAFVLLFALFSGLDIVAQLGLHGLTMPDHIEWWSPLIQYSSHVTQIFWVPNHALPGWWFAVLALLHARREVDLALLSVSFAAMLLWSPLSMMGALPLLALFGLQLLPRLFAPRILVSLCAGACLIPVALYLSLDAASVPHGFLLGAEGFATLYVLFIVIEIPHVAIVAAAWPKIEASDKRVILTAIGLLLAIPCYSLGPYNDFAMRASIIPLALLAFAFARVATLVARDGKMLASSISVLVIVSAATPLFELKRALIEPAFAISDCDFLTSWRKADPTIWPSNYLARIATVPPWLIGVDGVRLTIEDRTCWPDHPRLNDARK